MEIVIAILVFLGVVLVAVLFFGGWVIVSVVGLIARAIGGNRSYAAPPAARAQRMPPPQRIICAQGNCRAPNVAAARFCRRCGRPVPGTLAGPGATRDRAVVRRVAMW